MKKLIATAMAITMMMPAAAFAQDRNDRNDHNNRDDNKREVVAAPKEEKAAPKEDKAAPKEEKKVHKFTKGERFERSKAVSYRRVDHKEHSRLTAPPSGYVWVRAGPDALLARLSNNVVIRVVSDIY